MSNVSNSELFNLLSVNSITGESAWDLYKALNPDATTQDFLNFLKGTSGKDGKSAYEVWLDQEGNAGKTEADFFDAIGISDTAKVALVSQANTYADDKVTAHNTATDAHNDIRELIVGLTTRLNTLADSDDTTLDQMSELVAYIKANKTLIESITTNKISVDAIIDNLTTNDTSKVLSAAQGVVLKGLIDALTTTVTNNATAANAYTDNQINALNTVTEVTLTAAGWTGDTAPFTQTVNVTGVTEDHNFSLTSMLAAGADVDTYNAYSKAFGIITSGVGKTNNGSVTFYVYKKPDTDIVVGLKGKL